MRCSVYVRSTVVRSTRQASKSKPVSVTRISPIQSTDNNVTVVDIKQTNKQQQQQQQERVMIHKPIKSEVIIKKTGQRSSGGRHLQPPTGNNSKLKHECPFDGCPWRFATPYKLRRHIKSHTKETPYQCKECGRGFSVRYNLLMHIQTIHSTPHKYKCPMDDCKEAFHTQPRLNGHLRKIHKKDWKQLQAEQSTDNPSTTTDVTTSAPSSTSKWYKCINCTKEFSSQAKLSAHMRTHSGNFPCTVQGCSKSFQTFDKLTKHLDTSHKSLPCPNKDCKRVFLKQSQLKNHIKVHYSKYTCPKQDCNLKFDNEIDYKDHLNVHKGYSVPCPFKNCNLTFPTHNRLELHYRVAHLCQNGGDTGTDMLLSQLSQLGSQTDSDDTKPTFSDSDDFMDSIELPDLKVEDVEAVMLGHTNWTGNQIDTFLKSLEIEEFNCDSSLKSSLSGYESDSGYSTHEVSPLGIATQYNSALSPAITPVTPSTILSSSSSTSPVPFHLYQDDIFTNLQSTTPSSNTSDHFFFDNADVSQCSSTDSIFQSSSSLCHPLQQTPSQSYIANSQSHIANSQSPRGCPQSAPPPISNVSDIEANRYSVTIIPNTFCNNDNPGAMPSQSTPQFDNFLDGYLEMLNTNDNSKHNTGNENLNINNGNEAVGDIKSHSFDDDSCFEQIECLQATNIENKDEYSRKLLTCTNTTGYNQSNNNNEQEVRFDGGRLVIAQVVTPPKSKSISYSNTYRSSNKVKGRGRHHSVTIAMKGHQRGKKKTNWPKSMNSGNLLAFRNYILGKLKHNPSVSYATPEERLIDIQQQQQQQQQLQQQLSAEASVFYSVPNSNTIFNDIDFNPDTLLTCDRSSVASSCYSPFSHHSSPSPKTPMSPNLESSSHYTSLNSLSSVHSSCGDGGHLDIDGFIQCLSVDPIAQGLDQPMQLSADFCNFLKTDADPLLGGLS